MTFNSYLQAAHPDWFAMDAAGKPYKARDLYVTCVNGPRKSRCQSGFLRRGSAMAETESTQGKRRDKAVSVMAFGVGAYTHGTLQILKENGADVSTYLTRGYAQYAPSLVGGTFSSEHFASPAPLLRELGVELVTPMSIEWAEKPWKDEFLALKIPFFCPTGEGLKLERDRDFARRLCQEFKIPFPRSQVAANRLAAQKILHDDPRPYVIKNPLCSPTSPIHTIVCETIEDTSRWLDEIDYSEGVFLQEFMGRSEAGHIAVVSAGEIHSLVTNQEYKRAFAGNMGMVAGAPLGGIVERDENDKYGLARELLHPLLPWFRAVKYHGPVQVTAIRKDDKWFVLEYNVRLGVTSGPMILRLLKRPVEVLLQVAKDQPLKIEFNGLIFGCSLTLAGYGYPYIQLRGPKLPVDVTSEFDCDVWWNEVAPSANGKIHMTGHRIADIAAVRHTLEACLESVNRNIRKIRCLGSYFRPDIGTSLWPPGVSG